MSSATAKVQDPSMEEILASIRRIIADDSETPKAFAGPARPFTAAPPGSRAPETVEEDAGVAPGPSGEPIEAEAEALGRDGWDEEAIDGPEQVEAPVADRSGTERPSPPEPARNSPLPHPEPAPETLVSRETTATVAQAFGLLSHTVLTHNSQTLEGLVTEMLKPMLRMWLDDNLPPLVERLVRHEIERVARGGR